MFERDGSSGYHYMNAREETFPIQAQANGLRHAGFDKESRRTEATAHSQDGIGLRSGQESAGPR
jgi:hypothetical protein